MNIGSIATGSAVERFGPAARTVGADGGFAAAVEQVDQTDAEREQAYIDHLRSKYGAHFRIESIPRDPEVLERVGKRMSGDDVIIAPNIVAKMARDPEVAAYYEGTIDHCFERVPADKAYFAARGLTFEPCGVVVHEDGTVTYICGGGDTPERVAQVNAINAARDAKRAAQRRVWQEERLEHTLETRRANQVHAQAQLLQARIQLDAQGAAVSMPGSGAPMATIGSQSTGALK